jgi:hypothetical protein
MIDTRQDENGSKLDMIHAKTVENNATHDMTCAKTTENSAMPDMTCANTAENSAKPDMTCANTAENCSKPDMIRTRTLENGIRLKKWNLKTIKKMMYITDGQNPVANKNYIQLGFLYGQQSPQPATTASGFDRKATRNPQLYIVPYVSAKPNTTSTLSKTLTMTTKNDKNDFY